MSGLINVRISAEASNEFKTRFGRPDQVDLTRPTQIVYPPTPSTETIYAEIVSVGLNVRSGPGIQYDVIDRTTLVRGVVVPVLAIDPETRWLQVRLPDGRIGWISGEPAYVATKRFSGQANP